MQCEQPDTALVALDIHPVNFGVARDRLTGFCGIALDQRLDRVGNLTLDQTAHLEQAGAQAAQLLFILAIGMLRLGVVHFLTPRH